ncbi:MAG: hypothetical protein QXT73_08835 [Candidatus Methanomethylicaceae archaeon]
MVVSLWDCLFLPFLSNYQGLEVMEMIVYRERPRCRKVINGILKKEGIDLETLIRERFDGLSYMNTDGKRTYLSEGLIKQLRKMGQEEGIQVPRRKFY